MSDREQFSAGDYGHGTADLSSGEPRWSLDVCVSILRLDDSRVSVYPNIDDSITMNLYF